MIDRQYNLRFLITIFKCFFLLLLFGIFLPKILDYIIYYFVVKPNVYENSIFVYNIFNKNHNILYKNCYHL